MITSLADMAALVREHNKHMQAAREQLGYTKIVTNAMAQLLKEFPDLYRVWMAGYTPGFNDGDPCRFGLTEMSFAFDSLPDVSDDESYDGADRFEYRSPEYENHRERARTVFARAQELGLTNTEAIEMCADGENAYFVANRTPNGIQTASGYYDCGY